MCSTCSKNSKEGLEQSKQELSRTIESHWLRLQVSGRTQEFGNHDFHSHKKKKAKQTENQ